MLISASLLLLVVVTGSYPGALGTAMSRLAARDGNTPRLNYDHNVAAYCTWWVDINISTACSVVLDGTSKTHEADSTLVTKNPSLPEKCDVLAPGNSYCVEAPSLPSTWLSLSTSTTRTSTGLATTRTSSTVTKTTTTSTRLSTTTSTARASATTAQLSTTTRPANGVETPEPIQPGMVGNCNKFHHVRSDDNCADILQLYSISLAQFAEWNPAVKSTCSNLWADTWACVGVIGGTSTKLPPTTTTKPANGITTPTPAHPGMVSNCNKFVKVNPGDSCDGIAFFNGPISTENFVLWNAGVGGRECRGLQAGTYACIGVF